MSIGSRSVSPAPDFGGIFQGRRVLLTGHTGFKGGWLAVWLSKLGARVTGIALPPEGKDCFYEACGVGRVVDSRYADITDRVRLSRTLRGVDAEILIHMAAQPLVRRSYAYPVETFATNVLGTAHVLELAHRMPSLKAIVVVTSDRCYENREWVWGYRESDPLGGDDPHSASKGCTEILAHSYRRSFFNRADGPQLATVRAGNVFGGGDWGRERLVPDILRAASKGRPLEIRKPDAVRPWQHVLEPLSGYLTLAARLFEVGDGFEGAWNFGPDTRATVSVGELVQRFCAAWGDNAPEVVLPTPGAGEEHLPEAGLVRLDSTKAQSCLGWRPQLSLDEAVEMTVAWYRQQAAGRGMLAQTSADIDQYQARMAGVQSMAARPRQATETSRGIRDLPKKKAAHVS